MLFLFVGVAFLVHVILVKLHELVKTIIFYTVLSLVGLVSLEHPFIILTIFLTP